MTACFLIAKSVGFCFGFFFTVFSLMVFDGYLVLREFPWGVPSFLPQVYLSRDSPSQKLKANLATFLML